MSAPVTSEPSAPYPPADPANNVPTGAYPQAPPAYTPYSQNQSGYPIGQPSTQQLIGPVVAQPPGAHNLVMVAPAPRLGTHSAQVTCNRCQQAVWTRTERKPGMLPILSGFGIALTGFICGCCFIPCLIDSCMDVEHTCPNCSNYIGARRAI